MHTFQSVSHACLQNVHMSFSAPSSLQGKMNAACHFCDHAARRPGRQKTALLVACSSPDCRKVFCSRPSCYKKVSIRAEIGRKCSSKARIPTIPQRSLFSHFSIYVCVRMLLVADRSTHQFVASIRRVATTVGSRIGDIYLSALVSVLQM